MKWRQVVVVGVIALLPFGVYAALKADDRRANDELQTAAVQVATENAGLIAKDLRALGERSPEASVAELLARRGDGLVREWEELPDGGVRIQVVGLVTESNSAVGLPQSREVFGCFELHRVEARWSADEVECRSDGPLTPYLLQPPWFAFDPLA